MEDRSKKVVIVYCVNELQLSKILNKYENLEVLIIYDCFLTNANNLNFPITLKTLIIGVCMLNYQRKYKNINFKLPFGCEYKNCGLRNNAKSTDTDKYYENKMIVSKYLENYWEGNYEYIHNMHSPNSKILIDTDKNILFRHHIDKLY
ncbi:MAG: hypothetical protein P4L41_07845 [Flavipsychrobacter sp.]|nr:hypothetical protein [Flavipsychrobacter sp.]